MKPATGLRRHWPLLVLMALIVGMAIVLLAADPKSTLGRSVYVCWGGITTSVAIWQYCLHNVDSVQLWATRSRMIVGNVEIVWSGEVEYCVDDATKAVRATLTALASSMGPGDQILSQEPTAAVLNLQGQTVRVTAQPLQEFVPFAETEILRVDFAEGHRSYRGWRKAIDVHIPRILQTLEAPLTISERKYVSRIRYPSSNPYFGLFLARTPSALLNRIDLEYIERLPNEQIVIHIGKDQMEIVARSVLELRRQSLHLMALRSLEDAR